MSKTSPYQRGVVAIGLLTLALTGCAHVRHSIPVHRLNEPKIADAPRSSQEPINFLRLRQDPPPVYLLGRGDVLGIYIENVLGSAETPMPVRFPEEGSELPPAIGYPTPVREDGTLSLPFVPPIHAEGLTLPQVERLITAAYTIDTGLFEPQQFRILLTLMKQRTYHVLVIREDRTEPRIRREGEIGGNLILGGGKRGEAFALELDAYHNDVLHALSETGGLPGVDAKNEVTILRGAFKDADTLEPYIRTYIDDADSSLTPEGLGEILSPNPNVVKIPLRVGPYDPPVQLTEDDITLNSGDVVFIESRDAEVFYTGGLLQGGQFPIPRDYDLDVLGGIAMAGGSIAAAAGGSGTVGGPSRGGVGSIFPPTRVIVVRQVNGQQVSIRLCLTRAITDPSQRILVQPNDLILLEYTPLELVMNVLLNNLDVRLSLNELWD